MAMKKTGLGKGLDSMFPRYDTGKDAEKAGPKKTDSRKTHIEKKPEENGEKIYSLRISQVEPNRDQPRKQFDEDGLQELADSIKEFGIIQPLVVQKKGNLYEIIAGERRWRAARLAGLKEVPAVIKDLSPQQVVEVSLIENIQREDLNPLEEALAFQRLIDEYHLKQDEIAERVSKSRTTITNSLRLLKLSKPVQEMLSEGKITTGHARALLAITDPEKQEEAARRIFDEQLSVREVEKMVRQLSKEPEEPKPDRPVNEALELAYQKIEEGMKEILGTKVKVNHGSGKKGRIEIEYYSIEELERIFDMLKSIGRVPGE